VNVRKRRRTNWRGERIPRPCFLAGDARSRSRLPVCCSKAGGRFLRHRPKLGETVVRHRINMRDRRTPSSNRAESSTMIDDAGQAESAYG